MGENRLDVADEPRLITGQGLSLAVRPPRVLIFERRITAWSRQRCISFKNDCASASIFFSGWRLNPGTSAATSQLALLIPMTATDRAILFESGR
ncbi:hypothetical protein [Mesorhizobium dulcispinae]|uniref:hypothetical protein n=1 Tax=Mesorhizobium dulcispinae TaxID=3072316 RepID=UPI002A24B2C9|nr:hypothetical protein [Mesorhizobium sp. VK23D]MDX8522723.1 hypothetical protein [Mesorhizobium sp. VK23D]